MEQKKGIHRGWGIFISMFCLAAFILGGTFNINSVFILPVSTAMGITRGAMATWMTFQGVTLAICMPIWGNIMTKAKKIQYCVTIGVLLELAAVIVFATAPTIEIFYIGGVLLGAGMCPCTGTLQAYLSSNWFAPKIRGTLMGIASAGSSLGTFAWAPILASIIQSTGDYHIGYWIIAVSIAVICLPCAFFVIRKTPEECGLQPLGYDPNDTTGDVKTLRYGMAHTKIIATIPFWLIVIVQGLLSFANGYNSSQSGIAKEILTGTEFAESAAMIAAWMVSTGAVANFLSKFVVGFMCDRGWLKQSIIIFAALFMMTFVFWTFMPNVMGLYLGAFCLGCHNGLIQVAAPLLARKLWGPRDLARSTAYISMSKTAISGFMTAIIAYCYTWFGTYSGVVMMGIGVGLAILILLVISMTFIGKFEWTDDEGNVVPNELA